MVKALEPQRIATGFAQYHCAAMRTRVEKRPHDTLTITIKDQLSAADVAGHIVIDTFDFGFMAQIEPATIKDTLAFTSQNVVIHKNRSCDFELTLVAVLAYPDAALTCFIQRGYFAAHDLSAE